MIDTEKPDLPKRRLKHQPTIGEQAAQSQTDAKIPQSRIIIRSAATQSSKIISSLRKLFRYQPLRLIVLIVRVIGQIVFPKYFRNSWRELRQVSWPNRRQTQQLTFAVLIFAAIFGALVSILDYGLDKLFKQVLLK